MITNLRALRAAVEEYGGRITEIEDGGKHFKITVAMANGHVLLLRLSRSRVDPHKLRGWVRQRITNFTVNGKGSASSDAGIK
jgi:hypothetical protein